MNTIDLDTLDTNTTRAARRVVIAIVGALVLGSAAVATLAVATNVTSGGIFAAIGNYLTEVGEALGNG
jgi:hypothetical protein